MIKSNAVAQVLDTILAYKRKEVAAAKDAASPDAMRTRAKAASPVRSFANGLQSRIGKGEFALIAEIKKASPSKGLIRADFDPPRLARAYEAGGAACLSILTDTPSFQGRLEYLNAARNATRLPVLRKDFILDIYQVLESRAWGADCILIIMAAVNDQTAKDLTSSAHDLGMDVLAEVHNETELERALNLETKFIGINNRDPRPSPQRSPPLSVLLRACRPTALSLLKAASSPMQNLSGWRHMAFARFL